MSLMNGRVIAITGGASGIGLATAHLLLSKNATISIADINEANLDKAEKELRQKHPNAEILPYVLNVVKEEEVQKWIETIMNVYGRLDGAANMAGVIGQSISISGIDKQDLDEWNWILSINLTGTMLSLKHQLRNISPNGSIVNASSIAGVIGMANNAAYTASKHAVIGLTRSAAKEAGRRGVRVNAICPGFIDTPMQEKSKQISLGSGSVSMEARKKKIESVALGRGGTAEEVAELIVYLLGDGASFITGNAVSVDGGWNC